MLLLRSHLIVDSQGVRDWEGEQVQLGRRWDQPLSAPALIVKLTSHCVTGVNKSRQFGFLAATYSKGFVCALISLAPHVAEPGCCGLK